MKKADRDGRSRTDPEIPGSARNRESVENVILSVAAAERLVGEIGKSLLTTGEASAEAPGGSQEGFLSEED